MAMNQPSLDVLTRTVDSRYSLVVLAAKRARAITEAINNENVSEDEHTSKPVTMALNEIGEKKIKYKRTKQGIK